MSFPDLRSFIRNLEASNDLVRVPVEVDANQEVTVIQHRVLAAKGPALLFERVKRSPYRLVSNLFGTAERVEKAFGRPPAEIGEELAGLADQLMPPSPSRVWQSRSTLLKILRARLRDCRTGPILETVAEPPDLERLPVLTCWPLDGGPFFTLPLVHTTDPVDGRGNLGIYRLQRYDSISTGMHWQIEKGGAFHFHRACELGQALPISVFLGGPPALTIAAVAPLPEGIDERLLAAYLLGTPLGLIRRQSTGHRIPAQAEFVLEGSVSPGDLRREGPFGDHLGHYSHSADFPVLRVDRLLARRDAIYPATVVGKPRQEDFFIGCALQEMGLPLLRLMHTGICDLWAYPESGFHPLAVAAVRSRYPREALKHAMAILGHGQLSLTKVTIVVGQGTGVRDFAKVSRALWENLDPSDGIHLLAPTAQDTLDFTGPAMATGSRLILIATRREQALRTTPPPEPPAPDDLHPQIKALTRIGPAFLIVQVAPDAELDDVRQRLQQHPVTGQYLFQVLVSEDVPLDNQMLILWGWFTRFDPLCDLHPADRQVAGNRLIMQPPITIDATWKPGYRKPVELDPEVAQRVDQRWSDYGIRLP
jgi:UbiD family decarboxylase